MSDLPKLKPRDPDSHKGNYGRVLIIAGSTGLTGAAYLCSKATLRSGAGLVTLGIPQSLNAIMEVKLTCVMTRPFPETACGSFSISAKESILEMSKGFDAMVIGPGMSQHAETQNLICSLLEEINLPVVLDADGLNAIVNKLHLLQNAQNNLIITPHPGELARLMNFNSPSQVQADRLNVAKGFIKTISTGTTRNNNTDKSDFVLVLKGNGTVVANRNNLYINNTGNPGMASGGSGDVLSGVIVALLAQGFNSYDAARLGVYLHGLAGDIAVEEIGETSLIATDIIDALPKAFSLYMGS